MSASTDPFELAGDFPPATEDAWRALVAGVLRKSGAGADVDPVEALSVSTYDGIRVAPLYTCGPQAEPVARGLLREHQAGWDVRAQHPDPDVALTNAAVLADLETGATSLWLVLGDGGIAVTDLAAVLDGVYLDLAPVVLDAGAQTVAAAQALLALAAERGVAPDELRGSLGADPIGLHARMAGEPDLGMLTQLADLARPHPHLQLATVDASIYHDAGASDATEIAAATSVGLAYLRVLVEGGSTLEQALSALEFRLAVTDDQFLSIAKLRAARQVWARVAELSGAAIEARGQRQHAVTSAAMTTRRDPWVNMLRSTIGCFAAAVGGADAISVLAFDAAIGLPDTFARRIARNTQAILHDESSLGRVADAAGGSWYVETLTAQLADHAWDEFTAIERDGGVVAALSSGRLAARISDTRDARADDVAHRRCAITGVSEFALPDEAPLPRRPAPDRGSGGPLAPVRWAAGFEDLRDQVEGTDPRPAVFLAALGPFAAHSARVGFARNLFNAGGFRVIVGAPEDIVDSATVVACLCSSDAGYAEEAAAAAKVLRAAGVRRLWLAGRPGTAEADGYVYAGCDALDVLRVTLAELQETS